MVDLLFLIAFIALPALAWVIGRRLTPVVIGLAFGFGVVGNLAQTTIGWGIPWTVRTLQLAVLAIMLVVLGWSLRTRIIDTDDSSFRRQIIVVLIPALALGTFLIAMRVMADGAGPMSAVGYFINHPLAEDNAKWLHLTAQLADGREIGFNGYAGGPLLLLMAVMASLMSVLSTVWLGGVNEVAVAANTVIATQFLLIALIPFAFSPFAGRRQNLPAPLVWSGMVIAASASAVITSYGHLSLQFVLPVFILWIVVFATKCSDRARLLVTLTIVTLASVWLPLNILGIAILLAALLWSLRRKRWIDAGIVAVTAAVTWDALISSTVYLLGINLGIDRVVTVLPFVGDDTVVADDEPVSGSSSGHLFEAPGGTEIVQPLIGGLAVLVVLVVVWQLTQRGLPGRQIAVRLGPVVGLGFYALFVVVADAISTGRAPNYGANKLTFAVTISVAAALIPLALRQLDAAQSKMTALRWFAVGGTVALLSFDTMLPRALSALSPVLWPTVNAQNPQYWSVAEVRDSADQPISSLPVACLFVPQGAGVPTALPLGQESYACTRLLVGLAGVEDRAGLLPVVLQDDWLGNRSTWLERIDDLRSSSDAIMNRTVVVMTADGGTAGIGTVAELLRTP